MDINPGDRNEDCGGMMKPVAVEAQGSGYRILHRCTKCGAERRNKAAENDDFDILLKIAAERSGS